MLAKPIPPGPPPRRGALDALKYYVSFAVDPIGFIGKRFAAYGDAYYVPNADCGLFVFRSPEHIRDVLSAKASSFTKGHTAFSRLEKVLGDGLLTSDGETWKRHRRMITPAFTPARVATYAHVFVEEAERTAIEWERGGVRDVGHDMMQLTLRAVSRALFGHAIPEREIRTISRAMSAFQSSLIRPDVLPEWAPTPRRRRLERHARELDEIVMALITDRQRAPHERDAPNDLLDALLRATDEDDPGRTLTPKEVRDELVTLFLAGHETTSHALTFTWHCLGEHPEVERALHRELDATLSGRVPGVAELDALPLAEQIIQESMRIYPPVYAIARRANEDVDVGEWHVPAGSEVILWTYFTHHDPRLFPNPDAFRPERFDPSAERPIDRFAYVPFGAGPRTCVGKAFAMIEARLMLATIASRCRAEPLRSGKLALKPRITLTPGRAVKMRVGSR